MAGPKNGKRVTKTTNNQGIITGLYRGSEVPAKSSLGICFAMTVMWMKRVLQLRQVTYEANEHMVTGIQTFYMKAPAGKVGQRTREVLANNGMVQLETGDDYFAGTCQDAFEWIRLKPLTVFSISAPYHALAAFYQKPAVFYFDPNFGVYEYASIDDFCLYAGAQAFGDYCRTENEVMVNPVRLL